jgi:hypothetical protein
MEHEATTSKIGEDQIFYCNQRGLDTEDAVSMIVNGFCKEVFSELPMEFAVEAQKLLEREPRGLGGVEGSRMNVLRRRSAPRARAQSASENTRRTHGYASVFRRHLNSEPTAHLIRSGRSSWIHDTRRTQSAASALGRTEGRTCSN